MCQTSFLETEADGFPEYLQTWPKSGLMRDGTVYQQVNLAHHTEEIESGLWATPTTMDWLPQRSKEALLRQATTTRKGRTRPSNLREQVDPNTVKMWPTPNAREKGGGEYQDPEKIKARMEKGYQTNLGDAVKLWPTPRASKGMSMKLTKGMANLRHKKYLETEVAYQEGGNGGQLNPTWVEWLMGYPLGWTDLKD